MPDFEFTSPEGKKYTVTGPEGATQEQAWQMLQKQINPPKQEGGMWNTAVDWFKSIGSGAGQTLAKNISAGGQYEERMGTGQTTVPSAEAYTKQLGADYQPKGVVGRGLQAVSGAFADPASYMMPGGPGLKAASIAGGALGSQIGSELAPGSTAAPIIGGIAGGMLPGIKGAARAAAERTARLNPLEGDPTRQKFVRTLQSEGIEPNAGDTLKSKGVTEFQRFGSLPGGGKTYKTMKATEGDQLTQAVMAKMGEPGVTETSPEVWNRASDRFSRQYETAVNKIGVTFPKDSKTGTNAFRDAVNDLRTKAIMEADTPATTANVHKLLDRLLPDKAPGDLWYRKNSSAPWKMSGKAFQELNKMDGPIDVMINNPSTKRFGLEVKKLLGEWVEKSARGLKQKEALELFRTTNKQFRTFKVAVNAVGDEGAKSGHIDPQKLARAIGDEEALQRGKTSLDRLANAASNVMEPYRPLGFGGGHESGGRGLAASAARMGTGAALGAATGFAKGGPIGAAIGGGIGLVAPGAVARRINSPGVQAYLKGRPDFRAYLRERGLLTTPGERATSAVRYLGGGAAIGSPRQTEQPSQAEQPPRPQPALMEGVPQQRSEAAPPQPMTFAQKQAQEAAQAAAQRMRGAVRPPGGRQEGEVTQTMLDLAVPGRSAMRSLAEGNPGQAAGEAALSALPFGAAKTLASPIAKAVGASFAALAGMFGDTATGKSNLSPENMERLRMLQEKFKLEQQNRSMDAARRKQEAEEKAARDAEAVRASAAAEADKAARLEQIKQQAEIEKLKIEKQRMDQEREAAEATIRANAAENKRMAERPFRERHPDAALNLTLGGVAVAALIPGASRAYKTWAFNQYAKEWERLDNVASYMLKNGTPKEQALAIDRLKAAAAQHAEQEGKLHKFPWLTQLGSSGAAIEGALLPSEIDMTQPTGSEAHEAATKFFTNPSEWGRLLALYGGGALAGLTAKEGVGAFYPQSPVPTGTAGTLKQYTSQKRAATRAKKNPKPRLYE